LPTPPPRRSENPDPCATEDLVKRAAHRSEEGWAELLQKVESRLRVLIRFRMSSRTRGRFDADDLCQEVFIEAIKRINEFEYRGPGSLQRWLATILRYKLMHADRSASRLATPYSEIKHPDDSAESAEVPEGLVVALRTAPTTVSKDLRRTDQERKVAEVLESLEDVDREVILLKHYEGLSGREVAERLEVDESTVSVRYKRALERCAKRLPKEL